jgi:hypothetical protein
MVDTLQVDLVGPSNDHPFARELVPQSPLVWYLTGFLLPTDAPIEQKSDPSPEADEELDAGGDQEGGDDESTPEKTPRRRGLFPSSMGLSVLVPAGCAELDVRVEWGDYVQELPPDERDAEQAAGAEVEDASVDPASKPTKSKRGAYALRRVPADAALTLSVPAPGDQPLEVALPRSDGLVAVITARAVGAQLHRLPAGTRAVSVFIVNRRTAHPGDAAATAAFQVSLRLGCTAGFVGRVDPRHTGTTASDPDEEIADLHYRDVAEYAVGHGVSADASVDGDGACRTVWSTWMPSAEVERVVPTELDKVELRMEALGALADGAAAHAGLDPLVAQYRSWIAGQGAKHAGLGATRAKTAKALAQQAEWIADRIEHGIALLEDPLVLEAFRIANRAMARQARRRSVIGGAGKVTEATAGTPSWYPFQLAFFLSVLRGLVDPKHQDREHVDLLFFPTGGGKTEAYLGIAAFAMVLRRLRDPGPTSAGVCVLMRYTLRLLTLDQLGRATALMCALELEREKQPERLGPWKFEIGLWVGRAATPNRMGRQGDSDENSAYTRTERFKRNSSRNGAPIPIEDCPWCGTKFRPESFDLIGPRSSPTDLRIHCVNLSCEFNGDRFLPIVAVDEPIYRRLPAFLIATVDKFASLPWTAHSGALFGRVDRHDKDGFYGPATPSRGLPLGRQLPPPDLVIQDELHLISGPLGTIAGIYEAAIDALCTRQVDGATIRPKIVASTATVRRAIPQVRALFGRANVSVFPPPGVDRVDSFFARTAAVAESPARQYVGIAAQGRSLKVVFLRTALALLSAAQRELNHGGDVDAYMTLLGYFNSLRELGGSRRIVEDEIRARLMKYSKRRRVEPVDTTFVDREITYEPLELTSRVSTNDIAEAKRRLAQPFAAKDHVDIALATNMISVGLDIQRLGLMLVLGQPKTSAEYIQATSRVGRRASGPGLVVTLLNTHKPRDRSHYERFKTYHKSFYRSVEATSVTPFSPRALDRALAAALVAMCRHGEPSMTEPVGALQIRALRPKLEAWVDVLAERARNHANGPQHELDALADLVRARARKLLDEWVAIADEAVKRNSSLQYQSEVTGVNNALLHDFLDEELSKLSREYRSFRAARSMRDVEATADLIVKDLVAGGGA